jgi:poly(3-hydroxybutyrate) depolymerase
VSARACALLVVAIVVLGGCSGAAGRPRTDAGARAAPLACADRLPLDTLLDVPAGPRRPLPLILALHGARQGGYGMQRYTGLSDDARGFVVAYPSASTPSATSADVVTRLRWHGCRGGARVEHLRVADDTHGWPALEDANDRIVAFLRASP